MEEEYKQRDADNGLDDEFLRKYGDLSSYDELSPQLKIANIRQARSIPLKLNIIGCELADLSDERLAITEFLEDEVLDLAIFEHNEWCKEKIRTGWVYGEVRDDSKLIHDCLVPWEDLTPEMQKLDIDPVRNIPSLVDSLGLKIVRSKQRLLTFEMHKFYTQKDDFDELPDYIKYSNYKQTDFLVKILAELGYEMVDTASKENAIVSFDEDEINYLAKREHAAWYKLKINLGWKYGSIKDENEKTNPNLIQWDELDYNIQELNKKTFRDLPVLCQNVGLKIVKN